MTRRTATFLMIAVVALLMIVVLLLVNRQTIFQEGNPVPVFKGIYHIVFNNDPYVQIKGNPTTYITRADQQSGGTTVSKHDELFKFIESNFSVKFTGQQGDRYTFTGDGGKTLTVLARKYSRSFLLWEVTGQ